MKSVKYVTLICSTLLVFLSKPGFSQDISVNDAQENLFKLGGIDVNSGVVRKFDNRHEGVKGSPFYLDSWSQGTIDFANGQSKPNAKLKYNQYEDELIIQQSANTAYYLPKDKISSFTIVDQDGHSQLFIKRNHPGKKATSQFYRVITAGKVYLLEHTKVVFEKADFEGGYSNNKPFDEFKKYTSYYYLLKDSEIPVKLKQTINAVAKIFPGNADMIKAYISENEIDCRNVEELSGVFRYYNSLE